ncbi:MAG: hypothetical protein PPHEMADM_0095 [uncultured Paraburkholderia sp.]|nr:MAG: hypothetical protein PPHEMADE_0097 [uncultured Paraburkholderia sp.]CAH2907616.1 MAG: hypothetical protein PPHEMADM_0095 [uncultured Paraburkholderia sp.]
MWAILSDSRGPAQSAERHKTNQARLRGGVPEEPRYARQPDRRTTPATAGIFNQPGKTARPDLAEWPASPQRCRARAPIPYNQSFKKPTVGASHVGASHDAAGKSQE